MTSLIYWKQINLLNFLYKSKNVLKQYVVDFRVFIDQNVETKIKQHEILINFMNHDFWNDIDDARNTFVTIFIWQHILLDAKCLAFWQRHRVLLIILETYVISCFINSIFVNYNIYYSSFFKFLTQYYLFELLAIATIINKSKFFRRFSRWWCSSDFNV